MFNHSITNYIVPHDLHKTPDLISENFSVLRVIIYLLWLLNSLGASI